MKDIILIPAYYRPEYLALALEFLSKADGARLGKEYWVCQDYRYDDSHRYAIQERWTKDVIEASPLPVRFIRREPHSYGGNSYNTLEAYREAYETDARYIYLVEDDCLVMPDFFLWHEAVQAKEDASMCSIAYRCSRNAAARRDVSDPAAYFTSSKDYASIGVCWRREKLAPVVEHAKPEYYANPGPYLDARFPADIYSGWFHEQDGAIMRVMHERKDFTVWAYVPRIWHVGNVGYHRPNGKRADGQLQNKILTLRSWIHDAEKLKEVAPDFGDIEPVPMADNPQWRLEDLTCIQRFDG